MLYKKNTAGQFIEFQLNKTTDGTGLTGASVTVRRCIDGTFAAATGTVTEDTVGNSGWYKFSMSQADTNGSDIGFQFAATGAITAKENITTTDDTLLLHNAQISESYAANGVSPTRDQATMAVHQMLMQFIITGTSYTVRKLDNSTTAFVVTLNDATSPTSAVRT